MAFNFEIEEIMESFSFYRKIFNAIQHGIAVYDLDLNIVKLNSAMQKWYGVKGNYHQHKCFEIFHGRKKECENCVARKAIDTGQFHERTIPRGGPKDTPGWIKTSAFPITSSSGEIIGVVEFVRDVTKRKKAEEDLINSERTLKDIINFLPDPTFVITKTGEVYHWNEAIENLSGIKAKDILGKGNFKHALPFYGKRRPILADLALNPNYDMEKKYSYQRGLDGKLEIAETYNPNLHEGHQYLAGSASPLYDSQGNLNGAIETIRNITEKKNEEQRREALIQELKEALEKVKTLSGLLPICASCKKIRDDKGYWNQIESYIQKHSEAEFSHGMCPECSDKLYGDQDWYIKMKKKKGYDQ